MLTIGFANKFYTLWDCTTDINTDDHGVRHIKYSNRYIKNISFDLAKARAKYPEAPVDENLSGHRHSFSYTRVEYPDNVFKYGKYRGQKFTEVKDYDYMAWYFRTTDVASQEELRFILERHGYVTFAQFDKTWGIMTKKEYEEQEMRDNAIARCRTHILDELDHGTVLLDIKANPNCDGEYYDTESEFTFKFGQVRANYYQGFDYYLPVLNGKCKRVKNKTIKLTEAELIDGDIHIHKFEVVK